MPSYAASWRIADATDAGVAIHIGTSAPSYTTLGPASAATGFPLRATVQRVKAPSVVAREMVAMEGVVRERNRLRMMAGVAAAR